MTHGISKWILLAASGVLAAASAFAQSGGDNPLPAGDGSKSMAKAQAGSTTDTKAAKSRHASSKHAKARLAKHHRGGTMSSSGTAAARSNRGIDAEMDRCASMTDRHARAECASRAWERHHGTAG